MKQFLPNINELKIKTPTGYKNFAGVAYMGDKTIYQLVLSNGLILECSDDHKLYDIDNNKILLCDIKIGSNILIDGGSSTVSAIIDTGRIEPVYDLIDVDDGHRYYTDSILSSNCEFAGEESTLINGLTLQRLSGIEPIKKHNDVRWYDTISPEKIYLVSLDPAPGVRKDFACIQIWSLPDMVQVGEWTSHNVDMPNQVKLMQKIINGIHSDMKKQGYKGEPEIYFTLENNSWGEAALQSIADIGEENFLGQFLHEPKKPGVVRRRKGLNTNGRTKSAACSKLKSLVESNKLKINSKMLIKQLKFFISKGSSFEAKSGEHDDCVMSTILCIRMMQMVTNWDDRVGEMMKDVFDDDTANEDDHSGDPMPFSIMIS